MREQIQRPDTAVKRSSGWAVDKQLKDEYLHPSIIRFCAGFPVYRLREIIEGNWEIEEEGKSGNGKKLHFFLKNQHQCQHHLVNYATQNVLCRIVVCHCFLNICEAWTFRFDSKRLFFIL